MSLIAAFSSIRSAYIRLSLASSTSSSTGLSAPLRVGLLARSVLLDDLQNMNDLAIVERARASKQHGGPWHDQGPP